MVLYTLTVFNFPDFVQFFGKYCGIVSLLNSVFMSLFFCSRIQQLFCVIWLCSSSLQPQFGKCVGPLYINNNNYYNNNSSFYYQLHWGTTQRNDFCLFLRCLFQLCLLRCVRQCCVTAPHVDTLLSPGLKEENKQKKNPEKVRNIWVAFRIWESFNAILWELSEKREKFRKKQNSLKPR